MPYSKSTKRNYGDSPLDATKNGGHSPYKMKGHTLPGINQRSEGNTDLADGRYKPSAFTKNSPAKNEETKPRVTKPSEQQIKDYYNKGENAKLVEAYFAQMDKDAIRAAAKPDQR